MKSFKMKALALATLGLGGLVMAGAASAATCPAVSDLNTTWSGGATQLAGATLAVSSPGLDTSSCKLDATLGASSASQATVTDNSPNNEPRYRFQFLLNADAVTLSSTDSVAIFSTIGSTVAHARNGIIQLFLVPASGGNKRLSFNYSCNNGTTYRCVATTGTVNLAAGMNRIEFDVQMATPGNANGSIRYWINAAPGATEPTPCATCTISGIDNSAWVGPKVATLGLSSPAPSFSSAHHGQIISFDSFDSRRQTYIGN